MPSPGSYTDIFGGSNVYPSQPSYLPLNPFSASIVLGWPIEQSPAGTTVVANIMDVNPTLGGLTITLGDATQVSQGYTALFNNIGANSFNVLNHSGGVIATIASGTVWQLYLSDNTTAAGTWRAFQFGVGVSSATAAALAGAGLIAITTTLNENIVVNAKNANYNFLTADRATCVEWTGGAGTGTLPVAGGVTAPSGWFVIVKNNGSGVWTLSGQAGATIDGSATLALNPEQSCYLITDGANWITLGLGQQLNSIFDFVSISLTGQASPFVLSGVNLNRISYKFTGVLTAPMVVQVPNTIQQYWIDNETTGAFSLTIATPSGGGALTTAITQGTRNILYSDGTNVVPAVTFGSTGFVNGTAAIPSIFFTASPTVGFYSPGANQMALATSGTERYLASATGHHTIFGPDDAVTPSLIINNPISGAGIPLQLVSPFSSVAVSPLLSLLSTAVGGFATMSLCGNNGVVGTSDLSIFQNGASGAATILNRFSGANLTLGASGAGGQVVLQANGTSVGTFSASGANSVVIGSVSTYSIGLTNTTQSTVGAAGGASALPATPTGYLTINVNGVNQKIPYYAP